MACGDSAQRETCDVSDDAATNIEVEANQFVKVPSERCSMSMDLLRVTDATHFRPPPAGARMLRVKWRRKRRETRCRPPNFARLASPSSTVRLARPRLPRCRSVDFDRILDEAGFLCAILQSVIDLADSELGNDQLAVIMRCAPVVGWGLIPTLHQRVASGGLTKWRLERVLDSMSTSKSASRSSSQL